MTITIDEKHILLQFPYDEDILNIVRACPDSRKFLKKTKTWRVSITIDNLRHLLNNDIHDERFVKKLKELESPLKFDEFHYDFKTQPFEHQRYGFFLCVFNPEVFLTWEMGTGKSWVDVNVLEYLFKKGEVEKALILCPKGVMTSWANEFKKHTNLTPTLINGKKKRKQGKEIDERVEKLEEGYICIMNYDLLIPLKETLLKLKFDHITLDESHYIKSIKAKRTKIAHELCDEVPRKILLTGTPITQGPEDIFSQNLALDGGVTFGLSFLSFRNKYFFDPGYKNYPDWQIREGALDDIKKKMFLKAHRVMKKECFDLPEKNYQRFDVDMSTEQRRVYKELEKELYTIIQDEEISINYLVTKLMKLNQVTSGFLYVTDEATQIRKTIKIEHNKLKALRSLIEDKPKVVVWCLFQEDIRAVMEEFEDMHPVDSVEWEIFQEDPGIRLMVCQVHSGSTGITLTASNFVVYYSQGYSMVDRMQNEDRTHRIGTTGVVTYTDLVCPNTIDEDILAVLEEKRKVAAYLTDGVGEGLAKQDNLAKEDSLAKEVINRLREKIK